jgi:hypothetical protein
MGGVKTTKNKQTNLSFKVSTILGRLTKQRSTLAKRSERRRPRF